MDVPFKDRHQAGRLLAARLEKYAHRDDVVVFGLPRGGIPVAYEVAQALDAPLDVFLVRKLGVPGHEELAMGAIASGGVQMLNQDTVGAARLSTEDVEAVAAVERQELQRRERVYRGTRPVAPVKGRTVILVDDGLATGSTMRAAAEAVRRQAPARIVAAIPVVSSVASERLEGAVDEVVTLAAPEPFYAVGLWYDDFSQTTDREVQDLLSRAETNRVASRGAPALAIGQRLPGRRSGVRVLDASVASDNEVVRRLGGARFALIGEASHGTAEFYRERANLTKRLIEEQRFAAVAVEADWPDAYRVNCYVRGESDDASADEALGDLRRFPQWMWRNTVVLEFVEWLRAYNNGLSSDQRVGFYGLDLYSLNASIDAVIAYLDSVDPDAAARARARYACFDHYRDDAQMYGYATSFAAAETCEDEVVAQLRDLRRQASEIASRDGRIAEDQFFYAEQNARLARNAEAYYRSMFRGRVSSWNLRDRHMAETLEALDGHLSRGGRVAPRMAVWAHNSHLGDARATQLGAAGELSLGQLVRERYGRAACLTGFSTYHGTVTAASDWGAPAERKRVRPGLPGSYEALFHDEGVKQLVIDLHAPAESLSSWLGEPRLQRAIGVIYRPETERASHYFEAALSRQFDLMIHLDETHALEPLEQTAEWERGELPATFPFSGEPIPGRQTA
jgi:erythromycin esterase-like protein/predicted phosphoribosyltransferase